MRRLICSASARVLLCGWLFAVGVPARFLCAAAAPATLVREREKDGTPVSGQVEGAETAPPRARTPGLSEEARLPRLTFQTGHAAQIVALAFSPDGTLALSGSADKTARLWHLETGTELLQLSGHKHPVRSVAFSPDGRLVLTGCDYMIQLWGADSGKRRQHFQSRLTVKSLGTALQATGRYEVVPVLLTSEANSDGKPITTTATKDNLRALFQLLSGREVPAERQARLPQAERLRQATPDDLVLLSFSGHGYTDARGNLHLLPYDVGRGRQEMQDVPPRCISSADLAAWLREVDAGELVLILDACHAAAAGAPPGFKPGPLGSRGLAQLAYDKGLRVLAASQADDVALESEKVRRGLLTHALICDGLEGRRAMQEGQLTLGGLLAYAADRVPTLYTEVLRGEVRDVQGRQVVPIRPKDGERSHVQRPDFFDYARTRSAVVLDPAIAVAR